MPRILIADDDQFLAGICARAFEQAGYTTSVAHDGSETIKQISELRPDLVLLDLILPGVDGIEVLKFVRSRPDLQNLQVYIISSSPYFSGIVQTAWTEGATKFIRKGEFSPAGLVEEVRKSLRPSRKTASQHLATAATVDAASHIPTATPSDAGSKTALIADDDRTIHRVLSYFLGQAGFQIQSALNGKLALEVARHHKPSVLILDVTMPVMGGFETLAAWNQDPELQRIPVIMLTASHDQVQEGEAMLQGASNYLTKPFSPLALVKLANELTAGPVVSEQRF